MFVKFVLLKIFYQTLKTKQRVNSWYMINLIKKFKKNIIENILQHVLYHNLFIFLHPYSLHSMPKQTHILNFININACLWSSLLCVAFQYSEPYLSEGLILFFNRFLKGGEQSLDSPQGPWWNSPQRILHAGDFCTGNFFI